MLLSTALLLHTISISTLFLICLPFRIRRLSHTSVKILPGHPGKVKAILSIVYLTFQLSQLSFSIDEHSPGINVTTISQAISFTAALGICLLSFFEHRRSVHPSDLLSLYLLLSLIGYVLGLSQQNFHEEDLAPPLLQILLLLVFLLGENIGKESILRPQYRHLAPEETSGFLGRIFFWWINPLLKRGYASILLGDHLPSLDGELSSKILRKRILIAWEKRTKPESFTTLPYVLLSCFKWPLTYALVPRLFIIVFRYSQAVLINIAVRFINQIEREDGNPKKGIGLVLFAIVIYVGMAVSTAIYQHHLSRLKVMIRGALIELIYQISLLKTDTHECSSALTLMSSDVANLEGIGEMVHETWSQLIEVIIGTFLLASQIGWLCFIPLVIIFLGSRMSRYVARNLKDKQKNWSLATQKRIAMITTTLSSIKSMKMLGMAEAITSNIDAVRDNEIEMSKRLRWMNVAYNASANAIGIYSPVITLTVFAMVSQYRANWAFDSETVFTTTALLAMVTHPANMIMTIIPRAISSLANFERVQNYLLETSSEDRRITLMDNEFLRSVSDPNDQTPVVIFDQVSIQYPDMKQAILQDLNLIIKRGSIVMCFGPVGSGRTTLAKAILGEVPPSAGSLSVSGKYIGYCSQIPWLPSGTIKNVICGNCPHDTRWYQSVIDMCDLTSDLAALPERDQTEVGSRGMKLSGGQRQRVALARAVYARCDLVILDDPFSALDGKTEDNIALKLFGPQGLFRQMGTAVFLITHSAQHFHLADQVVILGGWTIEAQGAPEKLQNVLKHISKATLGESHIAQDSPEDGRLHSQILTVADAAIDVSRKTGDTTLYTYYFQTIGATNLCIMVLCCAGYSFGSTFSQYWLKWWTEADPSYVWLYIAGYFLLSFVAWIATSFLMWSSAIRIAPQSGKVLHGRLLRAIIGATLSYLSNTDTGITLNRFSQDIRLVDTELSSSLHNICTQIFKMLVQVTLLFIVQPMLAITMPACMGFVYIVQKIYLRTSRQLRFLELESRSALYSSFLETVEGTSTIRAFHWQKQFEANNTEQLEKSQRPFYFLLCLQRWLNIVLDLLIACIAVGIIALAVSVRGTTGAAIGVSLNLILVANITLLRLVENWTSLEVSLGAISRLKVAIEETSQESQGGENFIPSENWPSAGKIEINNVTASYNPHSIALQNISLSIAPGQKTVITGRTGSGKSTLLLTLLHLLDLQKGSITIDGVDIAKIPRSLLRQRGFIAVPQDAFIFSSGSLRGSLDPSGLLPDESIITALENTRLWPHFSPFHTGENILDLPMTTFPPLSPGQAQLFSLSRALLRLHPISTSSITNKPILLLDEATSSLDAETEEVVQDVIRESFTERGYTVLMVAHRVGAAVKNMREGDRVVVMQDGGVERVCGVGKLDLGAVE